MPRGAGGAAADHPGHVGQPEGHEQQAWLVDVVVVLVDDDDLHLVEGEQPPQSVGTEGPTGAPTENHTTR